MLRTQGRTVGRTLHWLFLWLWIGFAGGALVLFGVATPLEAVLRSDGFDPRRIDQILSGVAVAWALVSYVGARHLAVRLHGGRAALGHAVGAALSAVAFGAFLLAGTGPLAGFRGLRQTAGDRFVFGAYPDPSQVAQMRHDGFTGVISLLSPLIPFEAVLLRQERAATVAAGLTFVAAPMLPWVSANEASLDTIRSIARTGMGRYYVHCYLGRHRVEIARYAILEASGVAAVPPRITIPDSIERGPLLRLDSNLLLGPLPTRDEWFEIVVRSGTRRVIALLVLPVRRRSDARTVADSVRASAQRTFVHSFRTDARVAWVRDLLAPTSPRRGPAP